MTNPYGPRYYDPSGRRMTMEQWAASYGRFDPHVGESIIRLRGNMYRVSTVWLGLDHNWRPGGPPLIFETMIFEGEGFTEAGAMWRYSTSKQAIRGHMHAVRWLKRNMREQSHPQLIHNGRKPIGRWSTNSRKR